MTNSKSQRNNPFFIHQTIYLFLVLISLIFSACQPQETALHYGGQLYPEEFLLQGMDFWSAYDLDIEHVLFKNPDDLVQAFLSGVVDIALFSDIQAVQIFSTLGEKALIIGVSERGDRITTLMRADSEVEGWADLKGKKVALRSGSGAELVMERYFSQHKELDWESVEWVNLPVEDMPAALSSGAVEAITALEPIPAMAQASGGMRVLLSYGECCPSPLVLVTSRKFAKSNSNELVAFLSGHIDKTALIASDSALAARTAAQQVEIYTLDIPASAFHIVFKRVDFNLQIDDSVISALEETSHSLLAAGVIENIPEFFSDNTFLETALGNLAQ